jgi:hypothetical protein
MDTDTTSIIDRIINDAKRMVDDANRTVDDANRMVDDANRIDHKKGVVAGQHEGGIIISPTLIGGGRQINKPSASVRIVSPLVIGGGVQVNYAETDNGDVNDGFESHQSSTGTAAEDYPTQWNGGSIVINSKRADDKKT